jgi:ABC-2 type transport system permease protein
MMRNVYLIIKHEILTTLGKRSFWFTTIVFPLLILGLNLGTQVVSQRTVAQEERAAANPTDQVIGYVDPGGLIATIPPGVPAGTFRAYPDQAAAQAALEADEIARYYLIPSDWIQTGDLVLVDRTYKPIGNVAGSELFGYVLEYNLVGNAERAQRLLNPTPNVSSTAEAPSQANERQGPLAFWVPYVTMFIFFFSLTMSSGFMLQSVSKEKETRTAEVLLLSLRPRELMLGKLIGLGAVALLQLVIWAGGGLLALSRGEQMLGAAGGFQLPPGFIAWLLLYFVFGYAAYASVLGAIGVLAPTAREATQFTFAVLLPLMIPLWLNTAFTENPNGTLPVFLSLFPPTAPLAMITRLVATEVPLWQPLVGLAGLAAMAYAFVLLSARLFRADTLLSSSSLSWRRVIGELRRSRS